jgi:rod shape-determining protein MreD
MRTVVRVAMVLITAAVAEVAIASQLRIAGVAVDLFLLLAVCAGVVAGPDVGALVGFFAGLTLDLLVQAPMGLGALSYCLTGYLCGLTRDVGVRTSRWQPRIVAVGGSAIGLGLYAVASLVVGRSGVLGDHLLIVMLVVSLANGVLAPIGIRAMRWALGDLIGGERVAAR